MLEFMKHHWNKRDKFFAKWSAVHFAYALIAGFFIAGFLLLWQSKQDTQRMADLRQMAQNVQTASKAPPGSKAIGGAFELVNQDGKTVKDSDFRGKFMLIYFGYTYCPDMCPTGLQSFTKTLETLGPDASKIAPLFITIDPKRDTPEKLKEYVSEFSPSIQGLTGSTQQIETAANAYQVYYAKGEDVDDKDYVMDHSSMIYLMAPDGRFITTFPEEIGADVIVKSIRDYQPGN